MRFSVMIEHDRGGIHFHEQVVGSTVAAAGDCPISLLIIKGERSSIWPVRHG
jgi:hypothetical protein